MQHITCPKTFVHLRGATTVINGAKKTKLKKKKKLGVVPSSPEIIIIIIVIQAHNVKLILNILFRTNADIRTLLCLLEGSYGFATLVTCQQRLPMVAVCLQNTEQPRGWGGLHRFEVCLVCVLASVEPSLFKQVCCDLHNSACVLT